MGSLGKRRLVIFVVALVLGVLGLSLSSEAIRWRLGVVVLKASGQIDGLRWTELLSMIQPGSPFRLRPLLETPNPYLVIRNPRTSASDREAGGHLFQRQCASCHGADGEGATAPGLVGRALTMGDSDWSLFRTVAEGQPEIGMPSAAVPKDDVWRIVGYLRSLRDGPPLGGEALAAGGIGLNRINVPAARIEQAASEPDNWLTYSGSYRSWRYSELTDITTRNVSDLKLAWSLQFQSRNPIEASPIVVDGIMFLSVPIGDVLAVDAVTGRIIWRYSRSIPDDVSLCCGPVNRGVAVVNDRVFVGTLDGYLVALEAPTGRLIWQTKVADYREGFSITAAPLAVRNKIVVGVAGGEFGIRGFLDGYEATTGQRAWRFHTVPEPGQAGSDTWGGQSWKTGGGPTWLTGSFDPTLGLLYWGVGNPSPDFNGDSRPGDNLFTNSVVALNVDDGKLAWHFQFTPHDVHDWDANQIPVLVDDDVDGQRRPLMLWANRNGFYYVLDRRTGEFLHASPFVKQNWAQAIDPNGRPTLVPGVEPSRRGSLVWPGQVGGTNWWSPSYSPTANLIYVPFVESAMVFFKDVDFDSSQPRQGQKIMGSAPVPTSEPYQAGVRALNPVTGKRVWEYLPPPRRGFGGTGGTLATAGNLVFYGDGSDFSAIDAGTGRALWRVNLGGLINASPVSFAVNGEQRVAIPAGNTLFVFGLLVPRAWSLRP